MNRAETLKIFSVIKANYGNHFKNMPIADANAKVELWAEMFADVDYGLVGAAVKTYIASDTSGHPPNVGQINELIRKLTQPEEMTEQEAVHLILKAASNGYYGAEQEFEKLHLSQIINKFVKFLPRNEQKVFICRYWYMDSIQSISKRFGYSESKVKSMLFRTREKWRETLRKEGY